MKTTLRLLSFFLWNSKLRIARSMEYRFNFIVGTVVSLLISGVGPLVQYLIFTQTQGYPGWSIQQLVLFQGLMLIWLGIRSTAFGDLKQNTMDMIWRGDFDRLLLKPYPPIGIILTSGFNSNYLGTILAGLAITIMATGSLHLAIGLIQIGLVILCLIFGLLFNMAFDILFCGILIRIVQMGRFNDFLENLLNFSHYPVEIFSKVIRIAFVTFIPFAIWIYIPAQVLLKRIDMKILVAYITCLIIFQLSLIFWNHCLKKYTSAGG